MISKGVNSGTVAGTAPTSLTVNSDGIVSGGSAALRISRGNLVPVIALPPTLGAYSNATVDLSDNTTVAPSAAPTNAASISASTTSDFKGAFAVSPTTGVVTVTDAHPAGTYIVNVRAFNTIGAASPAQMFTLTVTGGTSCAGATTFTSPATPEVAAQNSPYSVAIGDFNSDGKQDFATANSSSGSVSIRLSVYIVVPATQASNITFSGTTYNQTAANWMNRNGAGRIVYVNTTNSFTNPTNGTSPTASAAYGGSGQPAVYNGTDSSVTVTNLQPATIY